MRNKFHTKELENNLLNEIRIFTNLRMGAEFVYSYNSLFVKKVIQKIYNS